MSKALEALKELKKRYGSNFSLNDDERCRIIEAELKGKTQPKRECRLCKYFRIDKDLNSSGKPIYYCDKGTSPIGHGSYLDELELEIGCKNYTLNIDIYKKLKALEVIKEKEVDIHLFKISANCDHYNWLIENRKNKLTQEEYELLKEVLL